MTKFEIKLKYVYSLCDQKKVKLTEKRQQVLYSLLKANIALSAYELLDCLKLDFDQDFAPMTVYRILKFLEEHSLVHKLQSTNKFVICAHISDCQVRKTPQFLICNSCQKVDEIFIEDELIDAVHSNIKATGFYISEPRFELNGICRNCQNN